MRICNNANRPIPRLHTRVEIVNTLLARSLTRGAAWLHCLGRFARPAHRQSPNACSSEATDRLGARAAQVPPRRRNGFEDVCRLSSPVVSRANRPRISSTTRTPSGRPQSIVPAGQSWLWHCGRAPAPATRWGGHLRWRCWLSAGACAGAGHPPETASAHAAHEQHAGQLGPTSTQPPSSQTPRSHKRCPPAAGGGGC